MNAVTTYNTFEIIDLKFVFNLLTKDRDWRDEINKWIDEDLFKMAAAAVEYYTATELKILRYDRKHKSIQVFSVGYRMGPAGP